jgi:hypothetical protein
LIALIIDFHQRACVSIRAIDTDTPFTCRPSTMISKIFTSPPLGRGRQSTVIQKNLELIRKALTGPPALFSIFRLSRSFLRKERDENCARSARIGN